YQVGFGSPSYFIKCFREQYGYPRGDAANKELEAATDSPTGPKRFPWRLLTGVVLVLILISFFLYKTLSTPDGIALEKSIAVLPFKNESNDSTNMYFINGLMESTLNNLQKVEDFRVVSRTSVEKYRSTARSIPEISEALNVNYLVEGSGQRVGDKVLLNIQLIEAASDQPIWSEQYSREVTDIFELQNEVAQKIAAGVEAIVTPAEREQISKKPTENLLAYDFYLQAINQFHMGDKEGLENAIVLFEKAIEQDPEFSLAYANMTIAYYLLDQFLKQKQYTDQINKFADKALLYDAQSAESLIAKAMYYTQTGEYRLALPHLEKALEYNPNSHLAIQMLADFYARVIPNTGKYLEYALKGIQLDIAANDSVAKSYIYLHLSNALVQTGFVDEAMTNINKSLDYDPGNYYSPLVKIYISYARDGDITRMQQQLVKEWEKDTTRLDILQEVGKIYYFQEDYENAFYYYQKFVQAKEQYGLEMYPQEDLKIGVVYEKMGYEEKAAALYIAYDDYCEKDQSIYKAASTAMKYAREGKSDEAIAQLKIFATQDNYQYWIVVFLEMDPLTKPLQRHPEFEGIVQKIKDRFWEQQATLKKTLEEKDLI
ncbi:MAG: AraC family transcriptional regulator, partial [Arenibacter sp.]|nr:AraC family transcriptional regulator [Arenibacter sp.]